MAFNIKNEEADTLLRELTTLTGESLTDAIIRSLRERLDRKRRLPPDRSSDPLAAAVCRLQALAVIDHRDIADVLGFDEAGLPQ